jgi:nucleoside-diphosphate-sugar epimerase
MVGRYVVDQLRETFDVNVLDIRPLHRRDVPLHLVDMLDFASVVPLLKGFDAVVHLAGIPHPLNDPPERVYRINTLGTFNILEAAALNGIRKFVFMSSESTLGFAFSTHRLWPLYVPIDEEHPLKPQDPYGLSKVSGEVLCRGYTRKTEMETVCLRPPWVWVPERNEIEVYRSLVSNYEKWHKNLWAYVHVLDVAAAVKQALQRAIEPRHSAYFITADEQWTPEESVSLLRRFYSETTDIREGFTERCSFISSAKAKRDLGFRPTYSVRDFF